MELISLSLLIDRIDRQIALEYLDKKDICIVFGKREAIEKPLEQGYVMDMMRLTKLFGYDVEYGNFNYGFFIKKKI